MFSKHNFFDGRIFIILSNFQNLIYFIYQPSVSILHVIKSLTTTISKNGFHSLPKTILINIVSHNFKSFFHWWHKQTSHHTTIQNKISPPSIYIQMYQKLSLTLLCFTFTFKTHNITYITSKTFFLNLKTRFSKTKLKGNLIQNIWHTMGGGRYEKFSKLSSPYSTRLFKECLEADHFLGRRIFQDRKF